MKEVLAKLPSPSLRAYVVWLPVLEGDDLAGARRQAARLHDPRVTQFWDPEARLGHELAATLGLPPRPQSATDGVAWDVYIVYNRGADWRAPPTDWMHQLEAVDPTRILDGKKLRAKVGALLR
jgi:hypothetical protein